MDTAREAQHLLKLLTDALETADHLKLSLIGCHIDRARAEVVEYLAKDQALDLGSNSVAR